MQKGQVLIFLLVGILIAAVAGGVLFYNNYKTSVFDRTNNRNKANPQNPSVTSQTPQPTSSPSPSDEITNWKTYTNTTYQYSIKHPSIWIAYDSPTPADVIFMTAPDYPSTYPSPGEQIEIEVENNKEALDSKQSAEKDAHKTCPTEPCTPVINFGEEVTVGGVKTLIVSGQLPKWTQEAVYLTHTDKIYIIRASSNISKPTITQTFRKMLPTFKFL